jgi:isoprenylcysteine carboxyl methyltransferase (ICMT) family protein YpbQ
MWNIKTLIIILIVQNVHNNENCNYKYWKHPGLLMSYVSRQIERRKNLITSNDCNFVL